MNTEPIVFKQREEAVTVISDHELALDGSFIPAGRYLLRTVDLLIPFDETPSDDTDIPE